MQAPFRAGCFITGGIYEDLDYAWRSAPIELYGILLHVRLLSHLFSFLRGLVHERFVDVRDDTATGDGGLDKGIQLFVTSNRKLQVSRGNTFHLCSFTS